MSQKIEQQLLIEIGEVENENLRLRTLNRKLQTQNYKMQYSQDFMENRVKQFKKDCNELAGDYYRTVNNLVCEKARLRTSIHDILFEHQETIPDGVYLQLMNLIKD